MFQFDSADAHMHDHLRETDRINREGWKFEALRRRRSAGRRIFHLRRRAPDAAVTDY